jgi:Xaa-Pro dipeptidase
VLANVERLEKVMTEYSIDAVIASTPENVTYLSGYRSYMHQYARSAVYVVWPRQRSQKPSIIMPLGESRELLLTKSSSIEDVRPFGEFTIALGLETTLEESEREFSRLIGSPRPKDALEALARCLKDKGLDQANLALDEMWNPLDFKEAVQRALPRSQMVNGSQILREIRMVKTPEEVRRLKRAAEITEQATISAMKIARAGVTGTQLAQEYNRSVIENSALPVHPSIAIGRYSYLQNIQRPPKGTLEKGDLIKFDTGCMYECYFSDIARTAVIGTPSEKQSKYYSALLAGENAAIDLVRAGADVSEIFRTAIEVTRSKGIPSYKRHHVGHGIGIEFYDLPQIAASAHQILLEGMVVNIELPYYELGFGGLHVEDTMLVMRDGCELLSTSDRNLQICS